MKYENTEMDALLLIAEKDKEIERLREKNERLREVLNKLEYYYDGITLRLYPTESEVEVALRDPNV